MFNDFTLTSDSQKLKYGCMYVQMYMSRRSRYKTFPDENASPKKREFPPHNVSDTIRFRAKRFLHKMFPSIKRFLHKMFPSIKRFLLLNISYHKTFSKKLL